MKHARLAAALAAGSLLPLASCARPNRPDPAGHAGAAASIDHARRRLEALAELEAIHPRAPTLHDAARAIDPDLPAPLPTGSAEFRRASRTLEAVLAELAQPPTTATATIAPTTPSLTNRDLAAKAYTRARAARLDGNPAESQSLMENAVRLDPDAVSLWRELGEARLAQADRPGAVQALTKAAELGDTQARVLLVLASDAAAAGDADAVVRWSARALSQAGPEDTAQSIIAGAMLGVALLERGDLLAGAQALSQSLDTLESTPQQPGDPAELLRLRARGGELRFRVGEAWALLGQPDRANHAYTRSHDEPGRAPIPLVQRRIATAVVQGRPASAALMLLDHTHAWAGDLGPEESVWTRALGAIDPIGPPLLDELARLSADASIPDTARRQILRVIVRSAADPDQARRAIADAGRIARSPVIAGDALRLTPMKQRIGMATAVVRQNPGAARHWAGPLSRLIPEPLTAARALIASDDPAERSLGLAMAAELNRPDLGADTLTADATEPFSPADAATLAELAGKGGLWDRLDPLLDAARQAAASDPGATPPLARALLACQRLDEAAALAATIDADAQADPASLLAAAEVALTLGDASTAIARLDRAATLDPFDENLWERRIALRSGDTPVAGQAETLELGRGLSERRPRSALFALLRASELAGQGMFREACELVMGVAEREPARDLGTQLLAQAAAQAGEQGDDATVSLVLSWLEARARSAPGSVPVALALAQTRLASDKPEEAFEGLDDAWRRIGHHELARNTEVLLAQELGRPDEAAARATDRLAPPAGVDASLERAEVALRAARRPDALDAARAALPPRGALTQAQARRWQGVVFGLARTAESPELAGPTAALLDEGARLGMAMPDETVRLQALLLARAGDTDRLHSMIRDKALGEETGLIVIQALLGAQRHAEGIDLLASLCADPERDPPINPDLLVEWARLVGAIGDAERVRVMLDLLAERALEHDAAEILAERFAPSTTPPPPADQPEAVRDRARIAYAAALVATVLGREAESEAMYRLTLELDPSHAWACNDLGYALADRGEKLDEAERLAERAFRALPDQASVLDSLGWARYKLDILDDERDNAGGVSRLGAVTLLTRAASHEDGRDNPTVHLHLGDALWRQGRRDDALNAWLEAERLLRDAARLGAVAEQPNDRLTDRINQELRQVRRRLTDAENNAQPPVAPIPGHDPPPAQPPAQPQPSPGLPEPPDPA